LSVNLLAPGCIGLWVHETGSAEGNLHAIQSMGFDYLALKVADGPEPFPAADSDILDRVAEDAGSIRLPLVTWSYNYPDRISAQIEILRRRIPSTVQDHIIDAESEWENEGLADAAQALCHGLAEATGHRVALHLSSFYDPQLHALFPYAAFLSHCNSFMPQSYVEGQTPASLVVQRTITSAKETADRAGRSIVPTVNRPDLLAMFATAGIRSANVWLWDGGGGDAGVSGQADSWLPAVRRFKEAGLAAAATQRAGSQVLTPVP